MLSAQLQQAVKYYIQTITLLPDYFPTITMPEKNHTLPRIAMDPSTPESPTCSHSYLPLATSLQPPAGPMREKCSEFHPSFMHVLDHLRTPLRPLISVTTKLPHPDFPATLLAYHLLTSAQLDSLARHYHQVWPPAPDTARYPTTIPAWVGAPNEHDVDLWTKRRRFGRFIGLRGCETPAATGSVFTWEAVSAGVSMDGGGTDAAHRTRMGESTG